MTVNDRGVKNEQMEKLRKTQLYGKIYSEFVTVLRIRGYCKSIEGLDTFPSFCWSKKKSLSYAHDSEKDCWQSRLIVSSLCKNWYMHIPHNLHCLQFSVIKIKKMKIKRTFNLILWITSFYFILMGVTVAVINLLVIFFLPCRHETWGEKKQYSK